MLMGGDGVRRHRPEGLGARATGLDHELASDEPRFPREPLDTRFIHVPALHLAGEPIVVEERTVERADHHDLVVERVVANDHDFPRPHRRDCLTVITGVVEQLIEHLAEQRAEGDRPQARRLRRTARFELAGARQRGVGVEHRGGKCGVGEHDAVHRRDDQASVVAGARCHGISVGVDDRDGERTAVDGQSAERLLEAPPLFRQLTTSPTPAQRVWVGDAVQLGGGVQVFPRRGLGVIGAGDEVDSDERCGHVLVADPHHRFGEASARQLTGQPDDVREIDRRDRRWRRALSPVGSFDRSPTKSRRWW